MCICLPVNRINIKMNTIISIIFTDIKVFIRGIKICQQVLTRNSDHSNRQIEHLTEYLVEYTINDRITSFRFNYFVNQKFFGVLI